MAKNYDWNKNVFKVSSRDWQVYLHYSGNYGKTFNEINVNVNAAVPKMVIRILAELGIKINPEPAVKNYVSFIIEGLAQDIFDKKRETFTVKEIVENVMENIFIVK